MPRHARLARYAKEGNPGSSLTDTAKDGRFLQEGRFKEGTGVPLFGAKTHLLCGIFDAAKKMGWLTGLEPATTGITIRDSTS